MGEFPLAGLKVLDFTRVVAGPYATRMLSDLGAEVLKVEPPEGDVTRRLGSQGDRLSGYYLQQNIGKRNICVDLKAPGARELILKLAATADIVTENFRPGVMAKFGIGWNDLVKVNPGLIMLSISEMANAKPVDIQMSVADSYSSLHGIIAILAALRVRDQSGEGQYIDMAMTSVLHSVDDYAHWVLDDNWPKPEENSVWDAPEGRRILIAGDMKWMWAMFSTQDGLADPTPDGADIETKVRMRREAMERHMLDHDSFDALTATLDRLNLAWGEVQPFGAEIYEQPSVRALGVVVNVKDEAGHARRTIQSPYRFSKSKSGIDGDSKTAKRGEHNVAALRDWLDMDESEISALAESKALISE